MALVKYIPNRFEDFVVEFESQEETLLATLQDFFVNHGQYMRPLVWKRKLVAVNDEVIPNEELEGFVVGPDDIIELTHTVEGGFFSSIASFFSGPKEVETDSDMDSSDQYDWEGPSTSTKTDAPVNILYGEHLTGGQLINFNIWSDGEVNYLDMLIALCEGEIAGVMNEDKDTLITLPTTLEDADTQTPYMQMNDEFLSAYEEAEWAGRVGTLVQTSIVGFRNIQNVADQGDVDVPGPDTWTTVYTSNPNIDRYAVKVACPSLFRTNKKGKIRNNYVEYQVRHKLDASPGSTWTYKPNTASWWKIAGKSKSEIKSYEEIILASRDSWRIQTRRSAPATNSFDASNELKLENYTEYTDEDLSYPNTAIIAVRVKATDQISGSFPNVNTLVRGRKVRVPDLGGGREYNDYYWTGSGLNYLLLADDTDPVTWDGTSFTEQWTQNPAYIMRDLLLDDRYGMGQTVDATDVDDDTIDATARWCWQKQDVNYHKQELNFVVDDKKEPPDILSQMALVSRIYVYWNGGYIKFKYERDESPVQLFSMGNITKDSFNVTYTAVSAIPNLIEVQYADADLDYKTITREVVNEVDWAAGAAKRRKTINILGVTTVAQALREAKLFLNKARYSQKTIKFGCTIGAAQCEPGDIIAFQHDVPQWGWGGVTTGGNSGKTQLYLDQPVPQDVLDDPTSYDIQVQHGDDTIDIIDITAASGNTLTIGSTFTYIVDEDLPYIIGITDSTIKEYRVLNMALDSKDEIKITAREHVAAIYTDSGEAISIDESPTLPNPSDFAPDVTGLILYELHNEVGFGVSFRQPEATTVFNYAEIWISTDNVKFVKVAEGYGDDDVEYYNCLPGIEYFVRVYSVNKVGIRSNTYVEDSIVLTGEQIKYPSTPTGLEIEGQGLNTEFSGRDCKAVWKMNAPYGGAGSLEPEFPAGQGPTNWALVKDFIVQIWSSDLTELWREEITTDQFYHYTWEKNWEDNVTYTGATPARSFVVQVYQRNYYNYLSVEPALLFVSNPKPNMTSVVPQLEAVFKGTKVDFTSFLMNDNDMDYYKIFYGFSNPPTGSVDHVSRNTQTHTVTGQLQNHKIFIQIEPYDLFGVGSPSQVASVRTLGFDFIDASVNEYTLRADSIVASIVKHGEITASHIGVADLSAINADLGYITSGYLDSAVIIGGIFQTALTGKRISITSDGIVLNASGETGAYGGMRYGNNPASGANVLYGSGALAYIHHAAEAVPFYMSQEQTVGDFHFYNRGSDPSGTGEIGDVCVVNGSMKICTSAGNPGTWTTVGAQL